MLARLFLAALAAAAAFGATTISSPSPTTTAATLPVPQPYRPLVLWGHSSWARSHTNTTGCTGDENIRRLGLDPFVQGICLIVSAIGIFLASVLYNIAGYWEIEVEHRGVRLVCIVLARLFIDVAIKLSIAFVVTTLASPQNDQVPDISGAYLTFVSAILTRGFHEAFRMTLSATGFSADMRTWHSHLDVYLSPLNKYAVPRVGNDHLEHVEELGMADRSVIRKMSLWERVKKGRIERKLLILSAVVWVLLEIYVVSSIIFSIGVRIYSLAEYENAQNESAANASTTAAPVAPVAPVARFFFDDLFENADKNGLRCPFEPGEYAAAVGIAALHVVLGIVRQPSLVPLLALTVKEGRVSRAGSAGLIAVLGTWVLAAVGMVFLQAYLFHMWFHGKVSSFWLSFLGLGPSTLSDLIFSLLSLFLGTFVVYGLSNAFGEQPLADSAHDHRDEQKHS